MSDHIRDSNGRFKSQNIDYTGRRFGSITVLEKAGMSLCRHVLWSCKCDCGKIYNARISHLLDGSIKSCGCSMNGETNPSYKHGLTGTPEYKRMVRRRRRARKRNAEGSFTEEEFKYITSIYGKKCLRCGCRLTPKNISRDHIRALSKGGSDDITNIQPLCKKCNSKKFVEEKDLRPFIPLFLNQ